MNQAFLGQTLWHVPQRLLYAQSSSKYGMECSSKRRPCIIVAMVEDADHEILVTYVPLISHTGNNKRFRTRVRRHIHQLVVNPRV